MPDRGPEDFKKIFEKVKEGYDKSIKSESKNDKQPAENVDFSLNPEQQKVVDEIKKEKKGLPKISNNSHHITPSSLEEVLKEKFGEHFPEIRSANNNNAKTTEPNSGNRFKNYDWDEGWGKIKKKEGK